MRRTIGVVLTIALAVGPQVVDAQIVMPVPNLGGDYTLVSHFRGCAGTNACFAAYLWHPVGAPPEGTTTFRFAMQAYYAELTPTESVQEFFGTTTFGDTWSFAPPFFGAPVMGHVVFRDLGDFNERATADLLASAGVTYQLPGMEAPETLELTPVGPSSVAPEPSTWALFATGLIGIGGVGVRRRLRR